MKIIKYVAFLLFLLPGLTSLAQNAPKYGLILEDYKKLPTLPKYYGLGFDEGLPSVFSLKDYCPYPGNQGPLNSCVGWATGYGAYSIRKAIVEGIFNRQQITDNAFSALFVYNAVKGVNYSLLGHDQCGGVGTQISTALDFLLQRGDCLSKDFDNPVVKCAWNPNDENISAAQSLKIQNWFEVFNQNDSYQDIISKTIQNLYQKNPVVIAMKCPDTFSPQRIDNTGLWHPEGFTQIEGGHAMVCIGYNNLTQEFEIMNSWGNTFGNGGFFYIRYADFAHFVESAFVLQIKPRVIPDNKLEGDFSFVKNILDIDPTKNVDINLPVNFNGRYYELNNVNVNVGDAFQLVIQNVPQGKYIYIFSIDKDGEFNLHFPRNTGNVISEIPVVPNRNAKIIIPAKNRSFVLDKTEDNLIILYSQKTISDINDRIRQAASFNGNISDKVQHAFGDIIIPTDEITYSNNKMHFTTTSSSGLAVPVMLNVK